MGEKNKINFSDAAEARLTGMSVEELRAARKDAVLKPNLEEEDWVPNAKPTKETVEEGWSYPISKTNGHPKPQRKVQAQVADSRSHVEIRKFDVLPTSEQCEKLQEHQEYKWFKDGMWQSFLKETKNLGLSEDERREEFQSICREFLREDIKVLVERGNLKNWQEFVVAPQKMDSTSKFSAAKPEGRDSVDLDEFNRKIFRNEQSTDENAKYLDRAVAQPWLEKLLKLTETERKKLDVDAGLLFYFLEGEPSGSIEEYITWPAQVGGREVTKEQYIEEAKKLEVAVNRLEAGNVEVPVEKKVEAKDWREVKREVEVDVVGDLHSNYAALKENLATLEIAKELSEGKFEWTGGDKKLVFIGDILADRNFDGIEILLAIEDLKNQAKRAGGEIRILAGNHDDFAMAYLMGRDTAGGGDANENARLNEQGIDLLQLREFAPDELKNYDVTNYKATVSTYNDKGEVTGDSFHDPVWDLMEKYRKDILQNMRSSPKGREVLMAICGYDIAEVIDDNLYMHTDPETHIVETLLKSKKLVGGNVRQKVESANEYFKQNLRAVLLEGKEADKDFDRFREVFLRTNNRISFADVEKKLYDHKERMEQLGYAEDKIKAEEAGWKSEMQKKADEEKSQLRSEGINAIIHGHSAVHNYQKKYENSDFPVISSDLQAFKHGSTSQSRSIIRVKKDGVIERGNFYRPGSDPRYGSDKQVIEIRSK